MIDGESSKAERLQKVFIWRYYCSYSDAYLIKSVQIWHEKQPLNTITLKELLLDKKTTEGMEEIVCATGYSAHIMLIICI